MVIARFPHAAAVSATPYQVPARYNRHIRVMLLTVTIHSMLCTGFSSAIAGLLAKRWMGDMGLIQRWQQGRRQAAADKARQRSEAAAAQALKDKQFYRELQEALRPREEVGRDVKGFLALWSDRELKAMADRPEEGDRWIKIGKHEVCIRVADVQHEQQRRAEWKRTQPGEIKRRRQDDLRDFEKRRQENLAQLARLEVEGRPD